jgi:hypothetical protein
MSSQAHELMLANSIMAAAMDLYQNYKDNMEAKELGQEYFSILLSLTAEEFKDDKCIRIIDTQSTEIRVPSIIVRALKSVSGAPKLFRDAFKLKLKQFSDANGRRANAELVKRYRRELLNEYINAALEDAATDQAQLRGAFETFVQLFRLLKIGSSVEVADQIKGMEQQLKRMQEEAAQIQREQVEKMQQSGEVAQE